MAKTAPVGETIKVYAINPVTLEMNLVEVPADTDLKDTTERETIYRESERIALNVLELLIDNKLHDVNFLRHDLNLKKEEVQKRKEKVKK